MIVYHGSTVVVELPQIIKTEYGRDFGFGFYTTDIKKQAARYGFVCCSRNYAKRGRFGKD